MKHVNRLNAYKFGQFVRSQDGHPARVLTADQCIYRTEGGVLRTDSIRQPDHTVREQDCPTLREIENFQKDAAQYSLEDHG